MSCMNEKEIKELEKNQRLSARSIPIGACFLVVAILGLWLLGKLFTISVWVHVIVLGLTAFTLIGDIYNYFYCGRKLKAIKQNHTV